MQRTKEYWMDNFIRFLIEGKREITLEEVEIRKQKLNVKWLNGPFIVAMVAPNYSGVKYQNKDEVIAASEKIVAKMLKEFPCKSYCITNAYNNIVVLLAFGGIQIVQDQLNNLFLKMQKKLVEQLGKEVFIGIGSVANSYSDVASSASDAQEMLGYKYQYAESGVINIANLVQFRYNISRGKGVEFERVIGCFQDGNLGKMEQRLTELIEGVRKKPNVSNTSIRRTLIEIVVHILHIASNSYVDVEQVLNNVDPYRWIIKQNHTEVITEWIMKISSELLMLMKKHKENEEKVVIRQAKNYIENNLSNIDLGLQQVSEHVGLSSSYCSQLFKNEVGMGINSYITQNRIDRAKKLLMETTLKSQDVAMQVGFSNASYFIQVFRKKIGITPNEYRRKIKHESKS